MMDVRRLSPALSRREFSLDAQHSHLLLLEAGSLHLLQSDQTLSDAQAVWLPRAAQEVVRIDAGSRAVILTFSRTELNRIDANGVAGNLIAPLSHRSLQAPLSAKQWQRLAVLIELIAEELALPSLDSGQRVEAACSLILTGFLRLFRTPDTPKAKVLPVVERFMLLVSQHCHDHWRVGDYARTLGITRFQLIAQVGKDLGCSPQRFIQDQWTAQAMTLLGQPQMRIAAIAYKLGFQDPAYFSRAFKKAVGQTPKDWRLGQNITRDKSFAAWP